MDGASPGRLPSGIWARAWARLLRWHRRASTRAWLDELPAERLRDIGVSPADAAAEARRPFWD